MLCLFLDECEICGEVHKFECCSLIGSIVEHIKDTETLPYAQLTLPESLRFQNLHDGRKTVLANKTIPKGVQFGPFIAKTSSIMDMRIDFPIKVNLLIIFNSTLDLIIEESYCIQEMYLSSMFTNSK